jgi:hypothetical protein
MESVLPYLVAPGSIKTALERIRQAATPERVSRDFMTTKLGIKGGTGYALISYLKKIGLINVDGTPSDLYRRFRNPATGGLAIGAAIKYGYSKLAQVNEYFYDLSDKDLQALIVQVTGLEANSAIAKYMFSTLKALKGFAVFDGVGGGAGPEASLDSSNDQAPTPVLISQPVLPAQAPQRSDIGLNLSYTINLNLPATADQSVFNAIFRSLREHLLSNVE